MWVAEGAPAAAARTIDVGTSGVSVSVSQKVTEGSRGQISFEMFVDGKSHLISAKVSVTYCIFSSGEFKAGLHFTQPDAAMTAVLNKYMR